MIDTLAEAPMEGYRSWHTIRSDNGRRVLMERWFEGDQEMGRWKYDEDPIPSFKFQQTKYEMMRRIMQGDQSDSSTPEIAQGRARP